MSSVKARTLSLLGRLVQAEMHEMQALLWAFVYFFALLSGYYILRPLRDEMGVAGGVENLQWLFTGTFAAMLLAVPLFGWVVARWPRRIFLPAVYWFFLANVLLFYLLLSAEVAPVWVARAFFIWVSLFNLFVVSVFWSFMADLFDSAQAKRLFGFIAAGGSAGALLGPGLTAALAVPLGPANMLPISAGFLMLCLFCIRRLDGIGRPGKADKPRNAAPAWRIGGSPFAGVTQIARSPYLLGVCGYIVLFTTTSTFLYFQQANLVAAAFDDPGERTRLFALIDLVVGVLTIATQLFVTGRILKGFGVGMALGFLPLLTLAGFAAFAAAPLLGALIAFQSIRRAANFAISKPAREVLFTVISREEKYKCKNFIDTVVYRGGDAASGWLYAGLSGLGLSLPAIAALAVPLSGLWLVLGLTLGRRHDGLSMLPREEVREATKGG